MNPPFALLAMLDSRAFASLWFWLLLAVLWWRLSARVLGVPAGVLARARRALRRPAGEGEAALGELEAALWVGLRRCLRPGPLALLGAVASGAAALAGLGVLGFYHGSEVAQALFLLLAPQASVAVLSQVAARELAAAGVAGLGAGGAAAEGAVTDAAWLCARLGRLQLAQRLIGGGWAWATLAWAVARALRAQAWAF